MKKTSHRGGRRHEPEPADVGAEHDVVTGMEEAGRQQRLAPPPEAPSPPPPARPAGERAEDVAGRLGAQVGRFAAQARHGLSQFLSRAREEAARVSTPQQAAPQPGADGATTEQAVAGPNVQRAEELVDRVGERFVEAASWAGHGVRKLMARAREEAEDILAEAQHIRRGGRPEEPPPGPEAGETH